MRDELKTDGSVRETDSSSQESHCHLSQEAQCYAQGRRAYPNLAFEWPEFRAAWAKWQRRSSSVAMVDDYVRLACLAAVPGAAEVFAREYLTPLRPTLARICQSEEETETALQDVREKLLLPPMSRLESYQPSGRLRAWLRVLATRTAIDRTRGRRAQRRREITLEEYLETSALAPEDQYLLREWSTEVRGALRRAVKRLPSRERQALRMHLVLGWSVTVIGRALSVHRATAARWIATAKTQLASLAKEELTAELGTSTDPKELFADLPSQLDLSLSQVFRTTQLTADPLHASCPSER